MWIWNLLILRTLGIRFRYIFGVEHWGGPQMRLSIDGFEIELTAEESPIIGTNRRIESGGYSPMSRWDASSLHPTQ
jgi:hypothetical protein